MLLQVGIAMSMQSMMHVACGAGLLQSILSVLHPSKPKHCCTRAQSFMQALPPELLDALVLDDDDATVVVPVPVLVVSPDDELTLAVTVVASAPPVPAAPPMASETVPPQAVKTAAAVPAAIKPRTPMPLCIPFASSWQERSPPSFVAAPPARKRFSSGATRLPPPMSVPSGSGEKFSPRGLVLDMDGLMVDSEPLWFSVERAFAAARGGDWTEAHARAAVGQGTATTLRTMHARFGFPVDVAADTRAIMEAFLGRVAELHLKPGLLELLDEAEGALPIVVASSSPLRLIQAVLARFALTARVSAVVSGESVASPKPAPDIFLRAAREIGVAPEACAVLEDSLAGVTAGRAAGMFVVAVPEHAAEGFAAVADRVVPDLFAARATLALPPRPARSA
jgi:sugar-phosphatase